MSYTPDIVTGLFSNLIIAQFTVCSFIQYNHPTIDSNPSPADEILPPWLSIRGYGSNSQQIVFDNNGFFICDVGRQCNRSVQNNFKTTPITANTWHHVCLEVIIFFNKRIASKSSFRIQMFSVLSCKSSKCYKSQLHCLFGWSLGLGTICRNFQCMFNASILVYFIKI